MGVRGRPGSAAGDDHGVDAGLTDERIVLVVVAQLE
jgi:hypothetical protein